MQVRFCSRTLLSKNEKAISFQSRFSVPWESHFPAFLSMATPQDSPYLPFMRNFVLKHIEQGFKFAEEIGKFAPFNIMRNVIQDP